MLLQHQCATVTGLLQTRLGSVSSFYCTPLMESVGPAASFQSSTSGIVTASVDIIHNNASDDTMEVLGVYAHMYQSHSMLSSFKV